MIIFFAENIMRLLVESIILILSRKVFVRDHRYNCCYVYKCISNLLLYSYMIDSKYIYMRVIVCSSYYKRNISQGREKKNVLHQ